MENREYKNYLIRQSILNVIGKNIREEYMIGLAPKQLETFLLIGDKTRIKKPITRDEIAKKLNLDRANIPNYVKYLSKINPPLVVDKPAIANNDPKDVYLTPYGMTLYRRVRG